MRNRIVMFLAAACAMLCAYGRTFSLDLREPGKGGARPRLTASLLAQNDGTLRSFDLDVGVADVGDVMVGDELTFALFDDVTLKLTLKEQMQSPLGGDVFLAEAVGYEGVKTAVVLRTADGLTIDVQDFLNDKVYKVVSTPSGVKVSEIKPSHEGKCGCDALEPPPMGGAQPSAADVSEASSPKSATRLMSVGDQSDTCVDILVAYDKNAAAYANSNGGGITNFAQVAVQKINAALANTGLDASFRFRLVGVYVINASATDVHDALYAIRDNEEEWNGVKSAREAVGADVVTTLIDTGTAYGTTGVGWSLSSESSLLTFGSSAYNVCAIRSVAQSHTMAHECGHNLGAGHSDVQDTQPGPQLYKYSAGYYLVADGKAYGTIMSYEHENPSGASTTEIPFFSSPNYTYGGVAVGDATHDNTRTIATTFSCAANWNAQKVPMSYDITFEPASGALVDGSLDVALVPGKSGVEVRYTLDGSDPTASSPRYTSPVRVTGTTTIKAVTVVNGKCSLPCLATYYSKADIGYALGLPELDWMLTVPAASFCGVQTTNTYDGVAIGATVAEGDVCTFSAVIVGPATITWNRMESGNVRLQVTSDSETIFSDSWAGYSLTWDGQHADIPPGEHVVEFKLGSGSGTTHYWLDDFHIYYTRKPVFQPASAAGKTFSFTGELMVSIAAADDETKIYYTLDGSDPNGEDAILYEGPFFINETMRIKAVAVQPGRGASAVAESTFIENHALKAGEWSLNGDAAYSAVQANGRMIAELCWNYPGCGWSAELEPVITDESFTTWAELNRVYLLADSWGGKPGASGSHFYSLYRQTDLYEELSHSTYYPTFVFAAAGDVSTCLGAMLARNDSKHQTNGMYYRDTVESLVACFASFLGGDKPLGAPVASAMDAYYGKTFPFSVTLANTNGTGTIYYTLDGTAPTRENGIRYTGSINIPSAGTTLKAVVWPSNADAVSGIPLCITYQVLDDAIGVPGVTWTGGIPYTWSVGKTSSGATLNGYRDFSLVSGSVTSSIKASVSGPGEFHFDYDFQPWSSTLEFKVNGTTVRTWSYARERSSTNYVVTASGKTEFEWVYDYSYRDANYSYLGCTMSGISWTPHSAPVAPTDLTASHGEHSYGTLLRWTASENAKEYVIYRGTTSSASSAVMIGTTKQRQYWDTTGEPEQTYHYWIAAANAHGESAKSASAAGWRPCVYTIAFNANGGGGEMWPLQVIKGSSVTLDYGSFTRRGYRIVGWALSPSGSVAYEDGATIAPTSSMELHAVWVEDMIWTIENGKLTAVDTNGLTVAVIPRTVTSIGYRAFYNLKSVTGVVMPESVTTISGRAFEYCSALVDISLPDGLTSIQYGAFEYCTSLTEMTIPDSVETIGNYAFYNCSGLRQVRLPVAITAIPSQLFYGCQALESITIPERVTRIDNQAFYRCSSLNDVVFGSSVETIGDNAFRSCQGLTMVTLPNGVTNVGANAFADCKSLNLVFAPAALQGRIPESAFTNCASNLQVIYYDGTVDSLPWSTISFNANGGTCETESLRKVQGYAVGGLPRPRRAGHAFLGWFTSADGGSQVTAATTVSGNMTIYAHWEVSPFVFGGDAEWMCLDGAVWQSGAIGDNGETWIQQTVSGPGTVTFDWNVSSERNYDKLRFLVDGTEKNAISGTSGTWTTKSFDVAGSGKHVLKWVYSKDSSSLSGSDCGWVRNVAWSAIVTVTFDANGGTGGTSVSLHSGEALSIPTVARTGYALSGWTPDVPATAPGSNATYVAQWTPSRYTVTFDANGGVGGWSTQMDYGSAIAAPTVMWTGHTFKGWSPAVAGTVPVGGATYVAQWEINRHTVTLSLNGGEGEGSVVVEYGTKVGDIVEPTRTGHTFAGWFTAAEGGEPIDSETLVTGDMELHAQWTPNRYTVTFNANGGDGSMDDQGFVYDVEQALSPVLFTMSDYRFVGWVRGIEGEVLYGDGEVVSNLTAEVDGNVTLYAVWEIWTTSMQVCEDAFGGAGTVTIDEDDNIVVTLTNDVSGTVEIPDNIGNVTIDLDGHSITGTDGGAAILVTAGDGDGDTTRLTIGDTSDGEKGQVIGDGESAGIEFADGAKPGVHLDVEGEVSVLNGDGTEQDWHALSPVEYTLKAGDYFKKTLAELGYDVPTDGTTPYTVKAYGLPAGLQLKSNAAVKDKKGKVTKKAKVEWWIEGVPTAALDFFTNPPYLVITVNGQPEPYALPMEVLAQEVMELDDLELGQSMNTNGWLAGVGAGWTVSGLPTGLKYATKKVTKKSGKKTVTVAEAYAVYGKTTKAGLFTITAKKKVGAFYETMKYRVLVLPAAPDPVLFGEELTNIVTMAYVPVAWDLVEGSEWGAGMTLPAVAAVGGKVAKVTGLPSGVKLVGQAIKGTPTKPGTYVVTFTKNVKSGKKTVAKTAQVLWVVEPNDAKVELGFNDKGGVIESGVVGLNYGDLLAFSATEGAKVTASGLPAGIALAELGGGLWGFSGFTTKAGTYLVTVKATLNGKTVTQRLALKVEVLPTWAKGTFNGIVMGTGNGETGTSATNGLATVTVSAVGKISGKFYEGGTNWTLTAASYTGYDTDASNCTATVTAKYSWKVKSGKKTVTKSVSRTFTLTVAPGEFGGVATLTETGESQSSATEITAWQNLWGSTYKALGKALFTSKSGKKTLANKTFTIKGSTDVGTEIGLRETDTLTLKVTTAGAVTATLSYDTGKTKKDPKTKKTEKVIYNATCQSVVIPTSPVDAEAFTGEVPLYFAPSAANGFDGLAGWVAVP